MSSNPAYPTDAQVQQAAATLNRPPLAVYAYAASYAQVPTNGGQVDAITALANQLATQWNSNANLILGYMQEHGIQPPSLDQLTSWAQGRSYVDSSGNLIYSPPAGANYLGDNLGSIGSTTTTAPATSTSTPAPAPTNPLSGIEASLSGIFQNKALLIGGAAVGGYLLFFRGHRR